MKCKRYILQQKCLNGQIGTCLLGTRRATFSPVHRPLVPQCTALQTDRQLDGQMDRWTNDDANIRSHCVAVRSSKNAELRIFEQAMRNDRSCKSGE